MISSGERLDLSSLSAPTVDKHSTGGVGDKVSLILAPLVASCGAAVPQLSGRGLGHTGGTLDKLESIPGWRASLSNADIIRVLADTGCVICAAGDGLAPADRRLYALRDVTGTIESIPLIASSIMSKKIAEGTGSLVLDVKVGSGAFMPDLASARELARTMVELGNAHGVRTSALLTRMDTPLGRAVGNAVEVRGVSRDAARRGTGRPGQGHARTGRRDAPAGRDRGRPGGRARRRARPGALSRDDRGTGWRPGWPSWRRRRTPSSYAPGRAAGFVSWMPGPSASPPGASAPGEPGRKTRSSAAAGIICLAKPGEQVVAGQPVLELRSDDRGKFGRALEALEGAIEIGPEPPEPAGLVLEQIG